MKLLIIIASLMVSNLAAGAELTPREWVSFLHQVYKRGRVQYAAPNVAFMLERGDGERSEVLHLVGVGDGEGGFTPSAVIQVQQMRLSNGVHVVATQLDLTGTIREISSRTLTVQSAGGAKEQATSEPSAEQKAEWQRSLEQWRSLVEQMPDRVGRFDAKEVAI